MTRPAIGPEAGPVGGPPRRQLVVGIGNELRRDDGLGPVIARAVGRLVPGADVLAVHQLLPEHAERFAGHRLVVLVDAAADGVLADGVLVRPLAPCRRPIARGHVGSPEVVLGLLKTLRHPIPAAWLVTVPASDLGVGEGLSPASAALVPDAVAVVARLLGARTPDDVAVVADRLREAIPVSGCRAHATRSRI